MRRSSSLLAWPDTWVDIRDLLVADIGPRQEEVVDHVGDRPFVPRDELRGKDGGVSLPDPDVFVLAERHQREGGAGLPLAPRGQDDDLPAGQGLGFLYGNEDIRVRQIHVSQLESRLDISYHAPAAKRHFAIVAARGVDGLLDPMDVRREHRDDDPASGLAEDLRKGLADERLRKALPFPLHVRGIGEQRRHLLARGHFREAVHGGLYAVQGPDVDLEVPRVDEHPVPASQDIPEPARDAVANRERLHVEISYGESTAPRNRLEPRDVTETMFFEPVPQKTESQRSAVHGNVEILQQERDRADVVLVSVREQERPEPVGDILETSEIGDDEVYPQHCVVREHKARVHEDGGLAVVEQQGVEPEFAQSPQGDDTERHYGSPFPPLPRRLAAERTLPRSPPPVIREPLRSIGPPPRPGQKESAFGFPPPIRPGSGSARRPRPWGEESLRRGQPAEIAVRLLEGPHGPRRGEPATAGPPFSAQGRTLPV
jgi:hypothetical protein